MEDKTNEKNPDNDSLENSQQHKEKEKYSYRNMMGDEVERQKKQLKYSLLGVFVFITISIIVIVLYIIKSSLLVPFLVFIGVVTTLFFTWLIISVYQCPSCRKHFARRGKKYLTSYKNTTTVRLQTGGTGQKVNTVRVFEVHCKYCGHKWIILK